MINVLGAFLVSACYLIGGQIEKSVRRYGVPSVSYAFVVIADDEKKFREKWRYIFLLGMIGILSMGYGENSWLKKNIPWEWAVRFVYSFLLSVIFAIAGANILISLISLVVAFQIRAGKLFSIGKFDFLIEDICRAMAIFISTLTIIH